MNLDTTRSDPVTVVTVPVASLDADNASEFRDAMTELIRNEHNLVVDLAELDFIDSSGLGAILSCLRDVTAEGGDLKLCGLSDAVRAVFDLVRLHRVLEIHPGVEQALSAFEEE